MLKISIDAIDSLRTMAVGLECERRRNPPPAERARPGAVPVRADTSDVAFRLLLALGDLWDGLQKAEIDPTSRGLHLTREYLGGYTRYSAGPSCHPRLVVEWNESSRHLRVIHCKDWPGFEATISATVAHVRTRARERGLNDIVDTRLMSACQEPAPARRTVVTSPVTFGLAAASKRAQNAS
jgi:hypothetical protein